MYNVKVGNIKYFDWQNINLIGFFFLLHVKDLILHLFRKTQICNFFPEHTQNTIAPFSLFEVKFELYYVFF